MARPPKYEEWLTEEGLILIQGWARDGLVDEQIAHNMGISTTTLYDWKNKFPELAEAIKKGKEVVDYQVENALFKNAMRGDTVAQIFWLKNRRPEKWRDRKEHTEIDLMMKEIQLKEKKLDLELKKLAQEDKEANITVTIVKASEQDGE